MRQVAAVNVKWLARVDGRGLVTEVMLFSDSTVFQNRINTKLFDQTKLFVVSTL